MTLERRKTVGAAWETIDASPNGSVLPNNWTASEDGSVTVNDGGEYGGTDYFILTAGQQQTFTRFLRVFNEVTLDDCDLIATNDNGELHLRIVSHEDGFFRAYKPDHSVYFELDSSDGLVKFNGVAFDPADLNSYQQTGEKGQADGYASLGSDGLVPTAQLPETPAVVPDVAYTESSLPTLSQGNVTAVASGTVRWQRMGRTVYVRVYLQTETEGQEAEQWLVDFPQGIPAIEYSGGSNGPIAVGSGYVNIGATTLLHVVTALAIEDINGPGPATRRIAFATADGPLGTAGAADRMGAGSELQLILVYEAADVSMPANSVSPVVTGSAEDGQTLTTTDGTWTGTPAPTFSYAWEVSDDSDPDGAWLEIGGETSSTLLIVTDYVDRWLRSVVTATNSEGSASKTSNLSGPVTA